jgi:hypothetical protein
VATGVADAPQQEAGGADGVLVAWLALDGVGMVASPMTDLIYGDRYDRMCSM